MEEIEIKQATKEGYIKCKVGGCYDSSYSDSKTRRGRVQNGGDVTPTITAQGGENINYIETVYRIRKLTPRECWRLMGYTDTDFNKAQGSGVSNSQLYKQAGNAIVKQVLMEIFKQMIPAENREQRTENREQRTENREQSKDNRVQSTKYKVQSTKNIQPQIIINLFYP